VLPLRHFFYNHSLEGRIFEKREKGAGGVCLESWSGKMHGGLRGHLSYVALEVVAKKENLGVFGF
jgi:hypothetical protein